MSSPSLRTLSSLFLPLAIFALPALSQVNLVVTPSSPFFPTNTAGDLTTFAPGFGVSSARAVPNPALPPGYKQEAYIPALTLFPSGAPTINDIASVSYWTNKTTTAADVDWVFYFYTAPTGLGDMGGFYHSRLNSEPYLTNTPLADDLPNQWHQWSTGGANPMRFYDANRNGGIFGTFTDPTLATLQAGPFNWGPNTNDYRPEVISLFSFQIGSCCGATFSGALDGVTIILKDGRTAKINFEADVPPSVYQVHYFSNLTQASSIINLTNDGASSIVTRGDVSGNICVNLYAFSPDEQLVSCCSCLVTPNALSSINVADDLMLNALTPGIASSGVVKLISTRPTGSGGATCNPALAGLGGSGLAPGLAAWGITSHPQPSGGGFASTETPFIYGKLSDAELMRTTQLCAFIQANGSGYGLCKSCRFGGLGASAR
jgi:hypothetical protein